MGMQPRAQIAIYAILAILFIVLFFVFTTKPKEAPTQASLFGSLETESVQRSVQGCVDDITNKAITRFAMQGGYLISKTKNPYPADYPIAYLSDKKITTLQQNPEQELATFVDTHLPLCVEELQPQFERYTIRTDPPHTTTHITPQSVQFTVRYPIIVKNKNQEYRYDSYTSIIQSKLSLFLETVHTLVINARVNPQSINVTLINSLPLQVSVLTLKDDLSDYLYLLTDTSQEKLPTESPILFLFGVRT